MKGIDLRSKRIAGLWNLDGSGELLNADRVRTQSCRHSGVIGEICNSCLRVCDPICLDPHSVCNNHSFSISCPLVVLPALSPGPLTEKIAICGGGTQAAEYTVVLPVPSDSWKRIMMIHCETDDRVLAASSAHQALRLMMWCFSVPTSPGIKFFSPSIGSVQNGEVQVIAKSPGVYTLRLPKPVGDRHMASELAGR